MDTIASMRAFVAVAKTGSFSAAAQKLDLVPSVITKRVTQLERIVGKTLFHRSDAAVLDRYQDLTGFLLARPNLQLARPVRDHLHRLDAVDHQIDEHLP
jgi:regulatory helix-turn-helix LysR family protein